MLETKRQENQSAPLMTPAEAADFLRVRVRTLADWRLDGKGPVYLKVGHLIRYRHEDIDRWLESHRGVSHEEFVVWKERARARRPVALPAHAQRQGAQRPNRFGRHQTKAENVERFAVLR